MNRKAGMTLPFWIGLLALLATGCGGTSPSSDSIEVPKVEAVTPEPAQPGQSVESSREKAFLWRAESPNEDGKVVYLLGSVHVANPDLYPLASVIEKAYEESDVLVVEIDVTAVKKEEMAALVLSKGVLPPGETLQEKVSKETWAKLTAASSGLGLPLEAAKRFKPWFAGLTIATLRVVAAGFTPEFGIDQYFMKKGDKKIVELETTESQMALFDDMSPELAELFLVDSIEGPLDKEDLNQLISSWATGDAEAMFAQMFEDAQKYPEYAPLYKKIFDDRNRAMAEGIDEILKTNNTVFVVVGAGHMIGEKGLVAIYRNKGYAVTQVEKKR